MDAQALVLLAEIVEAGNLSLAARRLKMSRANISYHLAQLEKNMGQELLRRTTRRLEPTEVGYRLYEHGCVIREELMAAQESLASLGSSLHGQVRLSIPTGFGSLVMSDWLIAFKRLYPGIVLNLLFENRVDDLLRDEVDIAIRVMSEPPQQLVAMELAEVRYVVCASVDYARVHGMPAQLEELAAAPVITSGVIGRDLRVSAYRNSEVDGAQAARLEGCDRQARAGSMNEDASGDGPVFFTLHPTLASENFQFLHEAVLGGLGVGLV